MLLPRHGLELKIDGRFDLPAFKMEIEPLSHPDTAAGFLQDLRPVSLDDVQELKRRYASLIIQIDRLRRAFAATNVLARTKEGEWSIKETLGHLIDTDRDIWWPRIELLLSEEHPRFKSLDQQEIVLRQNWQSQPIENILSQLTRARWDYAMKLNALSQADFKRCGEHATLGEISILRILQLLVAHDEHYLAKIRAMIKDFSVG